MTVANRPYLLDTNVLIWLSSDVKRIPAAVLQVLEDFESELWVSTVSFWELSIKQSLGKIDAAIRFDRMEKTHGIRELTISSRYTEALRELPMVHGDPFDRMLVAQAIVEGMVLVTGDRRLAGYPVAVLQV
jgi:PIN domain nuclease of toxin-antitoxin system